MIKVFLNDGTKEVEMLVEPNRLTAFDETFCRTKAPVKSPSKRLFIKCLMFADHYLTLDTKSRKIYDDIASIYGDKFKGQQQVKAWCDEFTSDIVDASDVMEFIELTELSGNKTLHTIAVGVISNEIAKYHKKNALGEFQAKYKIANDFTPAEITVLAEEDALWNKIATPTASE